MALVVKNPPANSGDMRHGFDPPGGGHGNSLLYSCLENLHGQKSPAGYSPQACINTVNHSLTKEQRQCNEAKVAFVFFGCATQIVGSY